jgi:hypothetical protein
MSQIVIPDGMKIGTAGFYLFAPPSGGNPNQMTSGLLVSTSVKGVDSVALGSLFVDVTTGKHWVKTGAISSSAPSGTWTAVTVP